MNELALFLSNPFCRFTLTTLNPPPVSTEPAGHFANAKPEEINEGGVDTVVAVAELGVMRSWTLGVVKQ
jgi:hypothetical protein